MSQQTHLILSYPLPIEIGVERDEVTQLVGDSRCRENGRGWAGRLARAAVDALAGIDEEMIDVVILLFIRRGMDTIDRADIDARRIFGADTRLGDHIGHTL